LNPSILMDSHQCSIIMKRKTAGLLVMFHFLKNYLLGFSLPLGACKYFYWLLLVKKFITTSKNVWLYFCNRIDGVNQA